MDFTDCFFSLLQVFQVRFFPFSYGSLKKLLNNWLELIFKYYHFFQNNFKEFSRMKYFLFLSILSNLLSFSKCAIQCWKGTSLKIPKMCSNRKLDYWLWSNWVKHAWQILCIRLYLQAIASAGYAICGLHFSRLKIVS